MKGRVILIDTPKDRASQAALLIDGRLEDLLLDPLKITSAIWPLRRLLGL